MLKLLPTREDIAAELQRLGFEPNSADLYDFTGDTLYARIVPLMHGIYLFRVDLAEKETFDRWGNSTNFSVGIVATHLEADLEEAVDKAVEICDSGLFDFSEYFYTIWL